MARYHSRQWTAITLDDVGAITPFEFCKAAQFIQYLDGSFQARTHLSWRDRPHRRETTTRRSHEDFHLFSGQALVQRLQKLAQHRTISFRKEFLARRCQVVDVSRLAAATTAAALLNQSVTLQGRELSADGVVGEVKRLGQFFHRPAGPAQQTDNLATCTRKKSLVSRPV